jgi:hypothetical protein
MNAVTSLLFDTRKHKARFWDFMHRIAENPIDDWYRKYCIDVTLSEWRMAKNCLETAKKIRAHYAQ